MNSMQKFNTTLTSGASYLGIISIAGLLFSIVIDYLSGRETILIYYTSINWIFSLLFAILTNVICNLIVMHTGRKVMYGILPYLFLIPAFLSGVTRNIGFIRDTNTYNFLISFSGLVIGIFVITVLIIELGKFSRALLASQGNKIVEQKRSLGAGDSILDSVIMSTLFRASGSGKMIFLSIIILLIITVIGGWASFGAVALNEARIVRELEAERSRLMDVTVMLKTVKSDSSPELLEFIKNTINTRYAGQSSYANIIENVEKQTDVDWPDIAMRVTIAALTLFLVQIFFQIYKYNQQQQAQLNLRAEVLELYKETSADQTELRRELLTKLEITPRFGRTPTTLADQILTSLSKSKDNP